MPEIQIRPGGAMDVNALIALDHSSQTEYVWQIDFQRDEDQTTACFREIRLPRAVPINYPRLPAALAETWNRRSGVLAALSGNEIIGYVRINDVIIPDTAWVTDLVVSPRHRRQGVGSALLLAAQTWAANRKNKRMLLEMISKNVPAIRLAQKLGCEFCGYNIAYYGTKDIALFFGRSIG